MTFLKKLDGEQLRTQQHMQLCDQRVKEVLRCQELEKETRREAKERLEETISATLSQLRITFDALDAAMKGINAGKKINIEDITVPTFGKIDDLKGFYSQSIVEASTELEEKRNQLKVEVLELEIHADKLQKLQTQELSELNEKKNALERKRKQIECERASKSKILAEEIKAAEIEMERRRIQRAIKQQFEEDLSRLHYAAACERDENARYDKANRKLQRMISGIEDECRLEVQLRLIQACQEGKIMMSEVNEDIFEKLVKKLVRRRLNEMLNTSEY